MKHYNVVTSCSRAGWKLYGERFYRTFGEHWPEEVGLHVFSEDLIPEDFFESIAGADAGPATRPTGFYDLLHYSPACRAFLERHAGNPAAHGRERLPWQDGWTPGKVAAGYNFRYDAFRFAKKVFAIEAARGEPYALGKLFWVDMDVVTFAPVGLDLLDELLPDDAALSCLDRGATYHSECGFVGYNLAHAEAVDFIMRFALTYATDQVLTLPQWHDSWVFDWLRRQTGIATHAIPHCSRHQPFINSALGRCMDHLKGGSKDQGRSSPRHMVAGHRHPYWRDTGAKVA